MKSVRLYGTQHQRSTQYLQEVLSQVQTALATSDSLTFGVAGQRLVVNGRPLPSGTAESSFAEVLNAGNIASIQFFSGITAEELLAFVLALSTKESADLAKFADQTSTHIHLNEVEFVARSGGSGGAEVDAIVARATTEVMAALIAPEPGKVPPAPAEFAKDAAAVAAGSNPEQAARHWMEQIAQHLQQATAGAEGDAPLDGGTHAFLDRLQIQVRNGNTSDSKQLLQLAERSAMRYMLERYQSGAVQAGAVNRLLQKLVSEVNQLRKLVGVTPEQAKTESPEALQREFWSSVPKHGKLLVLLTPDAWCIPAVNVESFVQELLAGGDTETATKVLTAYVACTASTDREARLKSAEGTVLLAGALAQAGQETMTAAVIQVARVLSTEGDAEVATALSTALARLTQQALTRRYFPAVNQSLAVLRHLEQHRPDSAKQLRSRIRIEERLPELVREAVESDALKSEFIVLLKRMPQPAMRVVLEQFATCLRRTVADRLANLASQLGEDGAEHLVSIFRSSNSADASRTGGILSRLGHPVLQQELVQRIAAWPLAHQDAAIRQIAMAGGKDTGMVLLGIFSAVSPTLKPVVLDEIGCAGDERTAPELLRMASSDDEAGVYLRLKAIEALGRMREAKAIPLLRDLILARKTFSWRQPDELRLTALHSLELIHPQAASEAAIVNALKGVPSSALHIASGSDWRRQRRYLRRVPNQALQAVVTTARASASVSIERLSLGGGLAVRQPLGQLGLDGTLEFMAGRRKLRARVLFHEIGARRLTFEVVEISLDDRWRLRRMLADEAHAAAEEPVIEPPTEAEQQGSTTPDVA
ncbi:MAG TPA: HEAT repeat domain-containing protein [Terriglobales bacterium]|nr:HEAT repeat domain-containing protein [Terriglobales bacterium]